MLYEVRISVPCRSMPDGGDLQSMDQIVEAPVNSAGAAAVMEYGKQLGSTEFGAYLAQGHVVVVEVAGFLPKRIGFRGEGSNTDHATTIHVGSFEIQPTKPT